MTDTVQAFGPYLIEGLLGRGQMGEVHQALDTVHGGRLVALKLLAPGAADEPSYQARFRAEARRAARLAEPHIVPVLDYGEINGRLYIAMQLVEGASLDRELAASGPMDPTRAVGIVEQVAAALDAAQAAGLVHRDVKPANILLSVPGADRTEFAQLADFGIAHPVDPGSSTAMTRTGSVMGSLAYMAPERFLVQPATPASDIYSLTCVLYELLVGARPYPGAGHGAQVAGHLMSPPPCPSAARPDLPGGFDGVVARGMAKDPATRFRTAGELAAAARAALASPPSTATPPAAPIPPVPLIPPVPPPTTLPTGPPPEPRARRRRRAALIAAAALVVAVGAIAAVLLVPGLTGPGPGHQPAAPAPAGPPDAAPSGGPITERVLVGAAPNLDSPVIAWIGKVPVLVIQSLGSCRVVDMATGAQIGKSISGGPGGFSAATVTQLGGRSVLVAADFGNVIRQWDLATGAALPTALVGHTESINVLAMFDLPEGPRLVSASRDGTIRLWDLSAGKEVGRSITGANPDIQAMTLSRTGTHGDILRTATLGEVQSWSLNSGTPFGPTVRCRGLRSIPTIEPATGDTQLVCTDFDTGYQIVDMVTGAVTRPPPTDADITDPRFATARLGRYQVVVLSDNKVGKVTIQMVDAQSGLRLGEPLRGHEGHIDWMETFDFGGSTYLVSSSSDRSIRIWNLSQRAGQ